MRKKALSAEYYTYPSILVCSYRYENSFWECKCWKRSIFIRFRLTRPYHMYTWLISMH